MKVLAVIPARGGSKGIPRKNLFPVAGRPLIAWTIEAARQASRIDRTVISTDDAEIAAVARAEGADVVERPAALAGDDTPTLPVLQHAVAVLAEEGYHPDVVANLQATSPLRTAGHIDAAIAQFLEDDSADSLVSCVRLPHVYHPRSVMRLSDDGYLEPYLPGPPVSRRQDKEPAFARNGAAIYLTRTARLSEYIYGGRLVPFEMTPEDSLDIDEPRDLEAADAALRARGGAG